MGLDGVELVLALEEGFGITITDAEAEACFTPAAVIDLVVGKLRAGDERVCASQRAFYLLRKGLTQTLGARRRSVTLDSDIRSFVAETPESQVWSDLKLAVRARSWPALARPQSLVRGQWLLSIGTFLALLSIIRWEVAAVSAVLVTVGVTRSTRRFRTHIPPKYSRIRMLVPFAVTSDAIFWDRDQVAALVRRLVTEQLGLQEGQYRESAHFFKDLGMD